MFMQGYILNEIIGVLRATLNYLINESWGNITLFYKLSAQIVKRSKKFMSVNKC